MGRPGVAAKLFDTLARYGINLRLIATSEVKVSCLVDGQQGEKALRAASEAFELPEQHLRTNPGPCQLGDPAVRFATAALMILLTASSPPLATSTLMISFSTG